MDIHAILKTVAADAIRGDIVFPTHTEIALRVQRLLDDPDCDSNVLAKLIAAEPMLSARVLSMANSLAYNPRGRTIGDVRSAIARLGFATLRALAVSIVVRQMKDLSRLETHRALAGRLWEHSANVAALARVIARRVTRQNPDAAFFAGIVHEVGAFYLISRAADFPGLLTPPLENWIDDTEATVGRAVLAALQTPEAISAAIETVWGGYLAMPPTSLGDTLLMANELSPIESPLDALDGLGRRDMPVELEMAIDDETLSEILAESSDEVASIGDALNR